MRDDPDGVEHGLGVLLRLLGIKADRRDRMIVQQREQLNLLGDQIGLYLHSSAVRHAVALWFRVYYTSDPRGQSTCTNRWPSRFRASLMPLPSDTTARTATESCQSILTNT